MSGFKSKVTNISNQHGRYYFGNSSAPQVTNLIQHQLDSFQWLVDKGLSELLAEVSPIEDYSGEKLSLSFVSCNFEPPTESDYQARVNNISYEAALKAKIELINKATGEVKKQDIYLGEYPWMTARGTFVINGLERVIISQLMRSAGVLFTTKVVTGRGYYGAKIIPGRGAWLEFETSTAGAMYVKIDHRRKLPVTTFLFALGLSPSKLKEALAEVDDGAVSYLQATLDKDPAKTANEALVEVYRRLRPGDLATTGNARELVENMFFDSKWYDLSEVGRYKFNKRLHSQTKQPPKDQVLSLTDLVAVVKEIVRLNNSQQPADDTDSLTNRRVRLVGELLRHQFRIGLLRMGRNARDQMSTCDFETTNPNQLVNARPITAVVREFFTSSPLSHYMEQVNPLAELSNKRRVSSTGPGGVNRQRAGFETRDIHPTHYGRVCSLETPDGINVGLVLNMSLYARVNNYGFLETPYYKVQTCAQAKDIVGLVAGADLKPKNKTIVKAGQTVSRAASQSLNRADPKQFWPVKPRLSDQVVYLDADQEAEACIAGSDARVDKDGYFTDERVRARLSGKAGHYLNQRLTHMDFGRQQLIGSTAGLIPFLENCDPYRTLSSSSHGKQAVPLVVARSPLIGTGLERVIAANSGQVIYAEANGQVIKATADEVVVKYAKHSRTYRPDHFSRSNDGTVINQRVIVTNSQTVKQDQPLIEGVSIDNNELALGQDVLVALMPWGGYNFEDAIIISQRLVKDDVFTSINMTHYEAEIRETKLGPETITRDIPNVSEESLQHLDDEGIVRVGAEVNTGDLLVGKITPKGEQELSSEERLLRAIFGEKAKDVRDTSCRMPNGKRGKVVQVRIFSKEAGHELRAGVIKQIQVYVAESRKIQIGDKLANRHGNKGVIATILPEEDMPFTLAGQPVDILINPLSILSRMNIGQLFEPLLGLLAQKMGIKIGSPAFDGIDKETIFKLLAEAGLPADGRQQLYDGRTGQALKEPVTVGPMYILKLNHMVDDKMHARSTGPYTLVTQQPLGGKAQNGGQRFGEMEVWALEAYGAADCLQEMLTIKSDDVFGRAKAYESIIKQTEIVGPKVPESFNVLVKELQGLGLRVDLLDTAAGAVVDAEDILDKQATDANSETSSLALPKEEIVAPEAGDIDEQVEAEQAEGRVEEAAILADNREDVDDQVASEEAQ